jgi:hypothetical protein
MSKIISWNTLYIEYEKKYNPKSKILSRYKNNEEKRIDDIVRVLIKNIDKETTICLQECSEILLNKIKYEFTEHKVFAYNIGREKDEYLITIAPKEFIMDKCIDHPTSNGYLSITNGKYKIVNCHLKPQRYVENNDVLKYLYNLPKNMIIAGDFNEKYHIVKKVLNGRYTVPKYGKTYKGKMIDHIIYDLLLNVKTEMIKTEYLSDHHAIKMIY